MAAESAVIGLVVYMRTFVLMCGVSLIGRKERQETQLLLGMADRTGQVVKLLYLRELVWQPSWELDNCPDWLS